MKPILLVPSLLLLGGLAHGSILVTTATLSGAAEAPPNASPGSGSATVTYNDAAHTLTVEFDFQDLLGPTTAAHIHAPTAVPGTGTAGVATQTPYFTGFPVGVTSGSYLNTFDLTLASSWNASYINNNGGTTAGAEAALATALAEGRAYLNIHTAAPNGFPGGEIRGFLVPVPEPGAYALLAGIGLCAFGAWRRWRPPV